MEIAVIGLGMMGRLHSQTLATIPEVSVTGFDTDPRARNEAEASGISVAELPAGPGRWQGFDGVVIALPDHLHVDLTIDALQAGIPVLVEKPLAASTTDCDRILAAAPRPERLMVGHVLRFDDRLRELRRRIGAGDIGPTPQRAPHASATASRSSASWASTTSTCCCGSPVRTSSRSRPVASD